MAEWPHYTCDWHDADQSAGDLIYEDQLRDGGGAIFERREFREAVFPAIESVAEMRLPARWHTDTRHVCGPCLRDPECRAWLDGWEPQFPEDAERLAEAAAA